MASDKVDLTEHRDFGGKFDDDEEYVNSIIIDEASELAADENMSVDDYMKLSLLENMFGRKIYHRYTSKIFNNYSGIMHCNIARCVHCGASIFPWDDNLPFLICRKCFENNEHQQDRAPWRTKLVGLGSRDATEIFAMK